MASDKDRRARQRGGGEVAHPLCGEDLQKYEDQRRQIYVMDSENRTHLEAQYRYGQYCLEVRKSGLWMRDPANREGDFLAFLVDACGRLASRSTHDRCIRLVEHYPLDEALRLYEKGVEPQALVECTYGNPVLRPQLLELAMRGVPIWQIAVARRAGNKKLKEAKKRASKKREAGGEPLAEAIVAMQQALIQLQKELAEERERSRRKKERKKSGQGTQSDSDSDSAGLDEVRQREREVALREHLVAQKAQEVEQKAAELELLRERLALRAEVGLGVVGAEGDIDKVIEARLQGVRDEQAQLLSQQEQLKEEKKKVALWQLQAEQLEVSVKAGQKELVLGQEQLAAGQRELARAQREVEERQKEAEAVAARLAEVQGREQEVAAQADGVAHREQEVARQMEEISGRIVALGAQETQIAGRLQEVVTREALMQTEQEVLEKDRRALNGVWEGITRRHFELERKARLDNKILWEWPWTMDDALNQAAGCLFRAMKMGYFLQGELKKGRLPQTGGPGALFDAIEGLAAAKDAMTTALKDVGAAYAERYPQKMERALLLREQGKKGAQMPLHLEIGRGPQQSEGPPDIEGVLGKGRCALCGVSPSSGGSGVIVLSSGGSGGAPAGGAPARSGPVEPPVVMMEPGVILGNTMKDTPQVGHLGVDEKSNPVAVCLNEIQSIIICGQQNFGKSVSAQLIGEMLVDEQPGVSKTPKPLAVMVAHYDHGGGYASSFGKILGPNPDPQALAWLRKTFGLRVRVKGAKRLTVYVPPNLTPKQMEQRRREYPGARILPIKLNMASLRSVGVRLVMGAVGNDALYIKKLEQLLSKMGDDPTLEKLEAAIDGADFLPRQRHLIKERLELLRDYVTDGPGIVADLRPGDMVIFDLRHDFLDKDTALALFAVLMDAHAEVKDDNGENFNKAIIFDEAHKFMSTNSPIREQVANAIKEMRHRHTWVIIVTQDPRCVPKDVNALSTITILHRISDRDMLKEMQRRNVAWEHTTLEKLATLGQAEAYVVTNRATEAEWTKVPHRVKMRPPCTAPGGTTRTAV